MYISPVRDAIGGGVHPTNHTDFVVAPLDQMFMLWSAINRISRAGAEIGPSELEAGEDVGSFVATGNRFRRASYRAMISAGLRSR